MGKQLTIGKRIAALVSLLVDVKKKFCMYPYALKKFLVYEKTGRARVIVFYVSNFLFKTVKNSA